MSDENVPPNERAVNQELKRALLSVGLCEILVPLTLSESVEVQGNSAAALSNLISSTASDSSYFVKAWDSPRGGLRGFLLRFLASKDEIDQHIAIWTLTQLLESNGLSPKLLRSWLMVDHRIQMLIRQTPEFPELVKTILRNNSSATDDAIYDSGFEDESEAENVEDGSEFINLTRAVLMSLKKLPTLEELEKPNLFKDNEGEEDIKSVTTAVEEA